MIQIWQKKKIWKYIKNDRRKNCNEMKTFNVNRLWLLKSLIVMKKEILFFDRNCCFDTEQLNWFEWIQYFDIVVIIKLYKETHWKISFYWRDSQNIDHEMLKWTKIFQSITILDMKTNMSKIWITRLFKIDMKWNLKFRVELNIKIRIERMLQWFRSIVAKFRMKNFENLSFEWRFSIWQYYYTMNYVFISSKSAMLYQKQ